MKTITPLFLFAILAVTVTTTITSNTYAQTSVAANPMTTMGYWRYQGIIAPSEMNSTGSRFEEDNEPVDQNSNTSAVQTAAEESTGPFAVAAAGATPAQRDSTGTGATVTPPPDTTTTSETNYDTTPVEDDQTEHDSDPQIEGNSDSDDNSNDDDEGGCNVEPCSVTVGPPSEDSEEDNNNDESEEHHTGRAQADGDGDGNSDSGNRNEEFDDWDSWPT